MIIIFDENRWASLLRFQEEMNKRGIKSNMLVLVTPFAQLYQSKRKLQENLRHFNITIVRLRKASSVESNQSLKEMIKEGKIPFKAQHDAQHDYDQC